MWSNRSRAVPSARSKSFAATVESTPPEARSSTSRSPTASRMAAARSSTWSPTDQSASTPQIPCTKFRMRRGPHGVSSTSGWNCSPYCRRASQAIAAFRCWLPRSLPPVE